jgi:formamidopyrimidine-DNA glycosylase
VPELPEIESLRRSLRAMIRGSVVLDGGVLRRDILHCASGASRHPLAAGDVVHELHRKGKQLVLEMRSGACLLFHLGMSGSIRVVPGEPEPESHVHARWNLRSGRTTLSLRHRDPRRFGWLESHASMGSIQRDAWSRLGPDALTVCFEDLSSALAMSRRPLKSLLLDQTCVAGLGNIYVDEVLFRANLHPECRSNRVGAGAVERLVLSIHEVLAKAVEMGGSTIRDHRTAEGSWGSFQKEHHVYGRAGMPCRACGLALSTKQVAQRPTVFCKRCQSRKP